MIPIRNRKKSLNVTVEEMRNFALAYVDKYAPSKQQLKTYLLKKYMKLSATDVKKKDVSKLIDIVLIDLEKSKFINDKFYSESKAKSMIQRGNSINKIRNYLIGKGINDEFIKDTVEKINEDNSDQDFFQQ
ncbi:RecX family transcriptional regulator [Candidatus Pelagibacter sp.]|nr:RecX family transcriptional regulator [Candidatus Pelagibacter sp.]